MKRYLLPIFIVFGMSNGNEFNMPALFDISAFNIFDKSFQKYDEIEMIRDYEIGSLHSSLVPIVLLSQLIRFAGLTYFSYSFWNPICIFALQWSFLLPAMTLALTPLLFNKAIILETVFNPVFVDPTCPYPTIADMIKSKPAFYNRCAYGQQYFLNSIKIYVMNVILVTPNTTVFIRPLDLLLQFFQRITAQHNVILPLTLAIYFADQIYQLCCLHFGKYSVKDAEMSTDKYNIIDIIKSLVISA